MVMSKIMKFFVIRLCFLYVVQFGVCLIINYQTIAMVIALTVGMLASMVKFSLLELIIKNLSVKEKNKNAIMVSIVLYILSLLVIGVNIVMSLRSGAFTFAAALIGTLSVIIVIIINAITEALGITKNHFGQKVK